MPISMMENVAPIANEVYRLQPKRVMDLGVGGGKYGVILREVLDFMHGRCRADQWETIIEGVEAHRPYINPAWHVYNKVEIYDFTVENPPEGYDLVLMIDSLEHLGDAEGSRYLWDLVEGNKAVIVSVPLGNCPQDNAFGNEYERHRTTFTGPEFDKYEHTVLHRGYCLVVSIKGRA